MVFAMPLSPVASGLMIQSLRCPHVGLLAGNQHAGGVEKVLHIHIPPFRNRRTIPINAANNTTHSPMAMRVAFTARSFSHQVSAGDISAVRGRD